MNHLTFMTAVLYSYLHSMYYNNIYQCFKDARKFGLYLYIQGKCGQVLQFMT